MGELNPEDELVEEVACKKHANKHVMVLACGALAKEIIALSEQLWGGQTSLQCLPAKLHNTPQFIPERVEEKLKEFQHYHKVYVAYADCGTGGALDRVLEKYPNAERLEGAHCYATYAGQKDFADMMETELGSFFLTDYMVRFFDRLILEGMGLVKHPELYEMYFGNYKKLVYIAQMPNDDLRAKAEQAAKTLKLDYEYRYTGFGELEGFIAKAVEQQTKETKNG